MDIDEQTKFALAAHDILIKALELLDQANLWAAGAHVDQAILALKSELRQKLKNSCEPYPVITH